LVWLFDCLQNYSMLIFTFLTCVYQNCQYMYKLQSNTKLRIKRVAIMYNIKTSNENRAIIWNGFGPFKLGRGVQVTAAAERQLMVFWRHPKPLINLFSLSCNTQVNDKFTIKAKIQTYKHTHMKQILLSSTLVDQFEYHLVLAGMSLYWVWLSKWIMYV